MPESLLRAGIEAPARQFDIANTVLRGSLHDMLHELSSYAAALPIDPYGNGGNFPVLACAAKRIFRPLLNSDMHKANRCTRLLSEPDLRVVFAE